MSNHPNMTAAGYSSGAASLLVWLLHSRFHVELSIYYSGLIVGGATVVVLGVGRRGIKGTLLALWAGTGSVWKGKQPARPAKS